MEPQAQVRTPVRDQARPASDQTRGPGEARSALRRECAKAIADHRLGAAAGALCCKVTAHRSEVICASGICLEIFVLANERRIPRAHSSSAQLPGLRRTPR